MKRFTKQACRENVAATFFPLKIFIPLCFNILSNVPRENRLADSLYTYIYIYIYIYIYNCYKKAIQSICHYNGNTRLNYVNPRLTSLICHLLNPKLFPVNLILTAYSRNHALFAARVSVRWFLYLTELNSTYSGLRIRLLERFKNVQPSRTRHAFAWLGFDDCMTWLWEAFR